MHGFPVNRGAETCSEEGQEVGAQPLLSLAQELVSSPQVPFVFYKEPDSNMQALSWRRKGSLSLGLDLLSFLCCNTQPRRGVRDVGSSPRPNELLLVLLIMSHLLTWRPLNLML